MKRSVQEWFGLRLVVMVAGLGLLGGCFAEPEEGRQMVEELEAEPDVFRFAFGSGSRTDLPQPVWDAVQACAPDVWIWAGNFVERDRRQTIEDLRGKFKDQSYQPGYRGLQRYEVLTIGVPGSGEIDPVLDSTNMVEVRDAFFEFFRVETNSILREREGTFARYDFYGDPEDTNQGDICVILLDTQTFREPAGTNADILGEMQWDWLNAQFTEDEMVGINFIVSSLPISNTNFPGEKWADYPAARQRLFDTLVTNGVPGVIFLTGGTYFSELSKSEEPYFHYPFYELTASGFTHVEHANAVHPNFHRMAEPVVVPNFGLVSVDWGTDPVTVKLQLRDHDNAKRMDLSILLHDDEGEEESEETPVDPAEAARREAVARQGGEGRVPQE